LCEQTKAAIPDTALNKYLQQAETASNNAMNGAETAQSALTQMQGTDVCNSGGGGNVQKRRALPSTIYVTRSGLQK
jgi:hypothetical protein